MGVMPRPQRHATFISHSRLELTSLESSNKTVHLKIYNATFIALTDTNLLAASLKLMALYHRNHC